MSSDQTTQAPPQAQTPSDWRSKLRNSRFGTFGVLAATLALVIIGAYFVQQSQSGGSEDMQAESAGVTAVELSGAQTGPPPEVGAAAQDFSAHTVDGTPVTLSKLRGKPVWLTFGASWCSACRVEFPDIQTTYEKEKANGLQVVGLYLSEDSTRVTEFNNRLGLNFPSIPDPQTTVASAYRVMGIPAHFFIDREGNIQDMKVGILNEEAIADSLGKIM
ncbi:MAG: TlpA disulfide reductase family protein [Dermatophilus congolensis]|nr:TlpA disulfide reductase family protein [Dermatophilus congolensis]